MRMSRRNFIAGAGAALAPGIAAAQDGAVLHRCGVLEMREKPGGEVGLYGWQDLIPNDEPVIDPRGRPTFVVTSSFQDKILEVHERHGDFDYEPLGIWPVVTPEPAELPGTIHGPVYRIDTEPDWYPSARLRRKYEVYRREHPEEDLPPLPGGRIPYGHPANPMGQRKIRANWRGRYPKSAVLHGTTGYPIELCGEETAGCVRIFDDWIVELVDKVLRGPEFAVDAGVEVILTPLPIARYA